MVAPLYSLTLTTHWPVCNIPSTKSGPTDSANAMTFFEMESAKRLVKHADLWTRLRVAGFDFKAFSRMPFEIQ
jgi:hypothetical protein